MPPKAVLAVFHQSRAAKGGQMAGNPRLRNPHRVDKIAHAEFSLREQMEYSQTRLVRESLEHQIGFWGGHIFVYANIVSNRKPGWRGRVFLGESPDLFLEFAEAARQIGGMPRILVGRGFAQLV